MPRNIDWTTTLFMAIYHLALLVLLPLYLYHYTPSWTLIGITLALFVLCNMAVTAGYHRLYSHRTFDVPLLIELPVLLFSTLATQGSALRWSYDHRLHHRHVDKEGDPYNVKDGFWHAHILWMFDKRPPLEKRVIHDLWNKPLLRFQHKHYTILFTVLSIATIALVGFVTDDYFGAFVFAFLLRTFLGHHTTWLINSAAHYWGSKTFSHEHTAVNNWLIALFTFGEGYHNYHHTFASDYRNGIRWYQWDPTKWAIWTLSKLGLARNLKTVNHCIIQRKIVEERTRYALEHAGQSDIAQRIEQAAQNLRERLITLSALLKEYHQASKDAREQIARQIKEAKQAVRTEWRSWASTLNQAYTVA